MTFTKANVELVEDGHDLFGFVVVAVVWLHHTVHRQRPIERKSLMELRGWFPPNRAEHEPRAI